MECKSNASLVFDSFQEVEEISLTEKELKKHWQVFTMKTHISKAIDERRHWQNKVERIEKWMKNSLSHVRQDKEVSREWKRMTCDEQVRLKKVLEQRLMLDDETGSDVNLEPFMTAEYRHPSTQCCKFAPSKADIKQERTQMLLALPLEPQIKVIKDGKTATLKFDYDNTKEWKIRKDAMTRLGLQKDPRIAIVNSRSNYE
ncbi:hypothetical protein SOPP22_06850 [Shewanella sp. OPT22]|nr:hypothetical protein SOPP22_06850 [Shewanella sp. OPT22]